MDKEGIRFTEAKVSNAEEHKKIPSIVIAERLHHSSVTIKYVSEAIEHIISHYGHRQKNMAESGVEYKGLFHALRLIYEANDLIDHGKFIFPFDKKRHDILKSIKFCEMGQEEVFTLIDDEVKKLYEKEKLVISNRKTVEKRIDDLEMALRGRMSVNNALKHQS